MVGDVDDVLLQVRVSGAMSVRLKRSVLDALREMGGGMEDEIAKESIRLAVGEQLGYADDFSVEWEAAPPSSRTLSPEEGARRAVVRIDLESLGECITKTQRGFDYLLEQVGQLSSWVHGEKEKMKSSQAIPGGGFDTERRANSVKGNNYCLHCPLTNDPQTHEEEPVQRTTSSVESLLDYIQDKLEEMLMLHPSVDSSFSSPDSTDAPSHSCQDEKEKLQERQNRVDNMPSAHVIERHEEQTADNGVNSTVDPLGESLPRNNDAVAPRDGHYRGMESLFAQKNDTDAGSSRSSSSGVSGAGDDIYLAMGYTRL